jgi:hypothetical protein
MPNLQFESITESLSRLPQVIQAIPDVVRDPSSNPLQAAILLGIAIVLILVVLLTIVLIVMRPSAEDLAELYGEDAAGGVGGAGGAANGRLAEPLGWLTVTSIIIVVVAALWVVTGITTASPEVCASCHVDTVHTASSSNDPHRSVPCVSCHESGGPVARATADLPLRVEHVVLGRIGSATASAYGRPVSSDACIRCHGDQISGVVLIKQQNVRVSHKEPMAAGAQCVDCHILTSGVISSGTAGMTPCLRCHNGTITKSECNVCHVGDPAGAIRSGIKSGSMASAQVPNPTCGGCHFDMTRCNACHGIAMPHSTAFKMYLHARPGALDIWDNGGKTCAKCHYPGHNNCQSPACHQSPFPQHPSPAMKVAHTGTPWSQSQVACSCHRWNAFDHNGMNFCQICHPVKPAKARP